MSGLDQATRVVRFGVFEVDLRTAELRKQGVRIRLPGQAFQVLEALLLHPGELVTREELKQKLWPSDTFGDFEHGLNAAVNRVREALGDSSDNPRFVETIPRRGYRFIAPVDGATPSAAAGEFDNVVSVAEPQPAAPGSVTPVPRSLPPKLAFWKVMAAVVLVAGIAVGSYQAFRRWLRPDAHELRAVPFNGLPGNAFAGSFSPDGQMIAFMWDQNKAWPSFDQFVQMVDGGRPLQVTHYSGWGEEGVWSPDGKSIALIKWSLSGGKLNDIVLVPALGGHEVVVEHNHFPHWKYSGLSWFPDGRSLAFTDAVAEGSAIFQLRLNDLTRTQLTSPPGTAEDYHPEVSPDGTEIGFVRQLNYGVVQLAVLSLDSRRVRILSTEFGEISGLTWDEKGRDVIYSSDRSGINRLWRISAKGGDARQINVGDDAQGPVISARTHRLAYNRAFSYNHIWRARLGSGSPNKETRAPLITSSRSEWQPQFSPDESKIAFISDRSGAPEVWVSNNDGSDPAQLTHMETRVTGAPCWSPDGQHIAFDSQVLGHYEIYVVDLRGGTPRRITNGAADNMKPGWSSDGKWIYYASEVSGELQIWKIPVQGGQPVQVTQHGGSFSIESAEGETLYFVDPAEHNEIWEKRLPDGEEKRLPGMPELAEWNDWQVTKNGIYFVAAGDSSQPQTVSTESPEPLNDVGFFDFSDGRVRTFAKLPFSKWGANGISVSQDGNTILYTHTDSIGSEIMLVDNFH